MPDLADIVNTIAKMLMRDSESEEKRAAHMTMGCFFELPISRSNQLVFWLHRLEMTGDK